MIRFPSIPASILTGAVYMPAFLWSVYYIEKTLGNHPLLLLWLPIGFLLPMFLSTVDFRYMLNRYRGTPTLFGKMLIVPATKEDFKKLYIPTWIRMTVLFFSMVASLLLLYWLRTWFFVSKI